MQPKSGAGAHTEGKNCRVRLIWSVEGPAMSLITITYESVLRNTTGVTSLRLDGNISILVGDILIYGTVD